jgi:SH3-like domain-containing protein
MFQSRTGKWLAVSATLAIAAPLWATNGIAQTLAPATFLNLRAAPDRKAPVIGVLRPGMPVHAIADTPDGWLRVQSADGPGWALGEFIHH